MTNMRDRKPCRTATQAGRLLIAGLLACGSAAAFAAAVAGPGGTEDQGRRQVFAAPAAAGEVPTLVLVSARIDAVDLNAGLLTVMGRAVPLHPRALRIIGPGGQALGSAASLSAGMRVRFALEPEVAASAAAATPAPAASRGEAPLRRIVLIYIDA